MCSERLLKRVEVVQCDTRSSKFTLVFDFDAQRSEVLLKLLPETLTMKGVEGPCRERVTEQDHGRLGCGC